MVLGPHFIVLLRISPFSIFSKNLISSSGVNSVLISTALLRKSSCSAYPTGSVSYSFEIFNTLVMPQFIDSIALFMFSPLLPIFDPIPIYALCQLLLSQLQHNQTFSQ